MLLDEMQMFEAQGPSSDDLFATLTPSAQFKIASMFSKAFDRLYFCKDLHQFALMLAQNLSNLLDISS